MCGMTFRKIVQLCMLKLLRKDGQLGMNSLQDFRALLSEVETRSFYLDVSGLDEPCSFSNPGWVGILSLPPALSVYSVRGIQQYTEKEQRAKEINIISSPTMLSLLPSLWLISLCAKREAWKTSPQNIFCYYRLHSRIF